MRRRLSIHDCCSLRQDIACTPEQSQLTVIELSRAQRSMLLCWVYCAPWKLLQSEHSSVVCALVCSLAHPGLLLLQAASHAKAGAP